MTYQLNRLSNADSEGNVVVHNKVDTNDISSVVSQVRTNVVSIASADDIYSGVIIEKEEGSLYIISVSEAVSDQITVTFDSGAKKNATVVGYDEDTDVCVLKCDVDFEVSGFHLTDDSIVKAGCNVIGVGGRNSVTNNISIGSGVCSEEGSYRMHANSVYLAEIYEMDMNVSEKQYGGALVDISGNLVGMLIHHPDEYSSHMSYALSQEELKKVYREIRKDGKVTRGSLDICVRAIKDMESYEKNENGFDLDTMNGLFVSSVNSDSCCYGILMYGDQILKVNDQQVDSLKDLRNVMYSLKSNDEVEITYVRDGTTSTSGVTLK